MHPDGDISATLTVVPLGTTLLRAPFLSDILITHIDTLLKNQKKVLIFYNRRGSGRALICQDCGYFPLCPHCDIALAYHTTPKDMLICHHCSYISDISLRCQNCQGTRMTGVGVGIQRVERDLSALFPQRQIVRIDSDADIKKSGILSQVSDADIILATYASIALVHQEFALIVFLLFESDLTLPDYRMEEEVYHTIDYAKKSGNNILIQTYTPEHPLLQVITHGNYKDFLGYITPERKRFSYPPYAQFALIRIHDTSKDRVKDIVEKMVNKITLLKKESTFIAYDRDIWEKYAGEWIQKIILKDEDLSDLMQSLEVEIVKNRAVTLEWR